jgi:hypothetical protein
MNLINVFGGILFVGPEPPIPKSKFKSSFLILNFEVSFSASFLLISIYGSSIFFIFNELSMRSLAAFVMCCLFFLKSGY